jgi:hypothetical protein
MLQDVKQWTWLHYTMCIYFAKKKNRTLIKKKKDKKVVPSISTPKKKGKKDWTNHKNAKNLDTVKKQGNKKKKIIMGSSNSKNNSTPNLNQSCGFSWGSFLGGMGALFAFVLICALAYLLWRNSQKAKGVAVITEPSAIKWFRDWRFCTTASKFFWLCLPFTFLWCFIWPLKKWYQLFFCYIKWTITFFKSIAKPF